MKENIYESKNDKDSLTKFESKEEIPTKKKKKSKKVKKRKKV